MLTKVEYSNLAFSCKDRIYSEVIDLNEETISSNQLRLLSADPLSLVIPDDECLGIINYYFDDHIVQQQFESAINSREIKLIETTKTDLNGNVICSVNWVNHTVYHKDGAPSPKVAYYAPRDTINSSISFFRSNYEYCMSIYELCITFEVSMDRESPGLIDFINEFLKTTDLKLLTKEFMVDCGFKSIPISSEGSGYNMLVRLFTVLYLSIKCKKETLIIFEIDCFLFPTLRTHLRNYLKEIEKQYDINILIKTNNDYAF